ncbi:hypothetical protein [Spirillospora sp. CA-128828]|uniref:hypothetical protein n=1 Tax=Spirillospora sp. CA-128828 TaxID=3240033 RepID=UPI003D93CA55
MNEKAVFVDLLGRRVDADHHRRGRCAPSASSATVDLCDVPAPQHVRRDSGELAADQVGCGRASGQAELAHPRGGAAEGDWRSDVLWAGLGISILLGGLALNGWMMRLCVALAWILPATLLFGAVVLVVDPEYGTFLDG